MSPQFVDFDADGHLDIVAGTYDGSPHVARGNGKGWSQPSHILDADGKRIVLNAFWNDDTSKWDKTTAGNDGPAAGDQAHCTSAVAFDLDGDGDFDLLLGDHRSGAIYWRENQGDNTKPAFAKTNVRVRAGGKAIDVPGTVATMRLVQWDGDGHVDLMVGGMGDTWGNEAGGGVYVYRADGTNRATRFQAPITLIPPSKKGAIDAPTRPDSALYPDAGDVDGDGDQDLIVGGYSHWTPSSPELTAEQKARAAELKQLIATVDKKTAALNEAAQKAAEGLSDDEAGKKYTEAYASQKEARAAITAERKPLTAEFEKLVPSPKRESFVWIYINTTATANGANGGNGGGSK